MILFLAIQFIAIPERSDSLMNMASHPFEITASGSLGMFYDGKCNPTFPNQTLITDEKYDWCSNIPDDGGSPWIAYHIPHHSMKLKGYAVRNGCCRYICCCDPTTQGWIDDKCCCELFHFSLQGSNDNHTWKVIHQIHDDSSFFHICEYRIYEFPLTESFKYVRFVLDEQRDGCERCMQINEFQLYGETIRSLDYSFEEDNEESVSIIGKVRRE